MDKYSLPTAVTINNVECEFNSDFRDILKIFKILNEPNLLEEERIYIALSMFYKTQDYTTDTGKAVEEMFFFINMGETNTKNTDKPLYSWEQDYNIIVSPINKTLGYDVRGKEYLHWWTFLSAFYEIGECTFSTYVSIRNKLNKNKKLEKYEEQLLKENEDKIRLEKIYDDTTQAILDEVLGKEA